LSFCSVHKVSGHTAVNWNNDHGELHVSIIVWLNTSQSCPAVIYCPITVTKALTIKLDKYSDSQDILLLYKVIAI